MVSRSSVRCAPAIILAASLLVAGELSAHDTWLLPSSMRVPVGRPVVLSLTSGMAFPADDFAIQASRVTRAFARLAGRSAPLHAPSSASLSLRYAWTPREAGVAALAIELAPKTLTLAPDKIEEYFADINASPALRAEWKKIPAPKQWRESYSKHAVSFVRVGEPSADSSWRAPVGLGFEIVPESDPTAVHAGDVFPVRVLRGGQPMGGLEVGAQFEGDTAVAFTTTDAGGRARLKIARSGRWLVNCTNLRRTQRSGLEWESDFATLTIATAPGGR